MSFDANTAENGIQIYHIQKALSKTEVAKLMKEAEKALSDGKSKMIVHLSSDAATGSHGYGYIEKAFRGLRSLAGKMNGDILYVLPPKISERLAGTFADLAVAAQTLSEMESVENIQEQQVKMREQIIFQEATIKKLNAEILLLTKKIKELIVITSKPCTQKELIDAVTHYRNLASELQLAMPTYQNPDVARKP